jgi:hypothetical protein
VNNRTTLFSALVAAFASLAAPAWAQLDDPATLHIGSGAGTQCATGGATSPGPCQYLYLNKEVNALGGGALDIYQTSNGADALVNPVLLILGVPNDIGSALAGRSITGAQLFAPCPGVATATLQMGFGTSA